MQESDSQSLFSPEEMKALGEHRQELLELIGSSQATIARCEDMLGRIDELLLKIDRHQTEVEVGGQQKTTSGMLSNWLTRKAS